MNEIQNYYAQAFSHNSNALTAYEDTIWSLFSVDLDHCASADCNNFNDCLDVFMIMNTYLKNSELRHKKFYARLYSVFSPLVIRYFEVMEQEVASFINSEFFNEDWNAHENRCKTFDQIMEYYDKMRWCLEKLDWPEPEFAHHIELRLSKLFIDIVISYASKILSFFQARINKSYGILAIATSGISYLVSEELCVQANIALQCREKVNASKTIYQRSHKSSKIYSCSIIELKLKGYRFANSLLH
ncbi:hypothetical protein ACOME3_009484 [Neoechinorhynchus agilis]